MKIHISRIACFLITLGSILYVPVLYASSPLDGVIPKQLYTAKRIPLGKPTTKTQTELDEELVKQVRIDKYNKYKDFNNYHKVAKLIAEGAFISDKALFSAITDRSFNNVVGKDFKSFQLMYLNGDFEPDIFNKLSCSDLISAFAPKRMNKKNRKNAHITSEQIALFLSDKADLTKCKELLRYVTTSYSIEGINLNVAKILIKQGVNTNNILEQTIFTTWDTDKTSIYGSYKKKGEQTLQSRYRVIKFLVDEGVKPTPKDLEVNFQSYIKHTKSAKAKGIIVQKLEYNQFDRITKLLLASGIKINKKTEKLFVEYRKVISKQKEKAARIKNKKDKAALKNSINLYPKVIGLFEAGANLDVESTVKINELTKQLHAAVVAKDKRRASFYLKKGAQGKLSTLRKTIVNNMDKVAIAIMEQKLDFDGYIIASLAIQHESPELVTYLLKKNKIPAEGSEGLVVTAANRKYTSLVDSLIKNGTNSENALDLSIDKYGSNYPSQIIADAGNDRCKIKLNAFKAEEARQSKIAKQKAKEAREKREQKAKQKRENEIRQYIAKKNKGDMVCKDGRMAIFLNVTIKAYVEEVSGNKIRIRIADTEGVSPYYNGVSLHQNTIIWDDSQEWRKCRF